MRQRNKHLPPALSDTADVVLHNGDLARKAVLITQPLEYAETKAQFDAVPWSDISDWLEKLAKLGEEKEQLETCLRDAGLGDLIR